jgi:hypothetical protein
LELVSIETQVHTLPTPSLPSRCAGIFRSLAWQKHHSSSTSSLLQGRLRAMPSWKFAQAGPRSQSSFRIVSLQMPVNRAVPRTLFPSMRQDMICARLAILSWFIKPRSRVESRPEGKPFSLVSTGLPTAHFQRPAKTIWSGPSCFDAHGFGKPDHRGLNLFWSYSLHSLRRNSIALLLALFHQLVKCLEPLCLHFVRPSRIKTWKLRQQELLPGQIGIWWALQYWRNILTRG